MSPSIPSQTTQGETSLAPTDVTSPAIQLTPPNEHGSVSHVVSRFLIIFAAVWFLALGTGTVEYAHNAQHEREDAKLAQSDTSRPGHDKSHPAHDDSNCPFHAQLHLPLI